MRFGAGTVPDLTWKQTIDTFSCTECGRCQDVCPAWNTGKELSPKLLIMALRDQVFEEGPALLRGADGLRAAAARAGRGHRQRRLGLRDLRRLRARVPGVDRARGPHRRPAPPPGDGGRRASRREAEPMLRDVERASNPWGKPQTERADWAEQLGVRVLEPGEPGARGPLLGRLRGVVRRARPHGGRVDGEAAAGGRRGLRDPRPARVVHRRPGAPDGQRVPLPGARRAEREHAQRGGRDQDRRELPALLQHARQRVPATSAATTRSCTTPSCSPSWCATGGLKPQQRRAQHHLPRLLLPGPPQRRARRPARAGRGGRRADRDGAQRQAHVLLRRRRRAHVDGGARRADQRGARARGGRDRRRHARRRLPVLHGDARRRRARRAATSMRVVDVSTLLAESLDP